MQKTNILFTIHGNLKKDYFIQFAEIISTEPVMLSLYGNVPVELPDTFHNLSKMDKYDFVFESIKEYLHTKNHPVLFQNLNQQVVIQYGLDDLLIIQD